MQATPIRTSMAQPTLPNKSKTNTITVSVRHFILESQIPHKKNKITTIKIEINFAFLVRLSKTKLAYLFGVSLFNFLLIAFLMSEVIKSYT